MLQRIQSVYIFIALILMALSSYLPLVELLTEDGQNYIAYASGIRLGSETILSTLPLVILTISSTAINAIALFSFKKRMLQIRFLIFSIILQLGTYGLAAYYFLQLNEGFSHLTNPSLPITFPLISVILCFLAIRAIGKDEALVRSLDRIR